ncbi:MAG: TonB-dependent receptor plug domain-containing protein [Acidobacteria bacterium]|nr:TonB-dependent receptor plug domain-containing protein [Acidobacteriota bacterium]
MSLRSIVPVLLVSLVLSFESAFAQLPVADMSVEELLDVQVTSVSRKAQRLARAPAAVYVITQEELRRSGVTSIAEALRLVPGMHVGRLNGGAWAISARGGAARYANKMLVMVDGRSVYSTFYGGVFWEYLDLLMEDIDRIEVIRGPGGVMWGANAVNGVVNVITRSARQTVGNLISVTGGNQEHGVVAVRHGARFKSGAYRVWGKSSERTLFGGTDAVYRQDYSMASVQMSRTRVNPPDGSGFTMHGGFRVDWDRHERDQFSLSGDVYGGAWRNSMAAVQPFPPYGVLGTVEDRPAGGNVLGRWTRTAASGGETSAQVYFDRFQGQFPYSYDSTVFNLDLQQARPLNESNELMWSFNFRQSRAALRPAFGAQSARPVRSDPLFSGVLQHDLELTPNRWYLSLGARLEHNNFTGFEFQPSIRVLHTPSRKDSYWAAWSRAVRTPTMAEHNITYNGFAGVAQGLPVVYGATANEAFRSEKLYAHEGGYRHESKNWTASAALFYNRYTDVRSYLPSGFSVQYTPTPYVYGQTKVWNARNETIYGGEVWGAWSPLPKWKLMPSYSWLRRNAYELEGLNTLKRFLVSGEEPAHQVRFRSLLDLTSTWQLDTAFYYTSAFPMHKIAAHPRLDVRVSWRPTRKQEWSAGLFDATEGPALEGPPEGPALSGQMRRMWQLKWVYRF